MKKFKNLTPEESKEIDISIYKNALSLKKDALLLGKNRNSYASATSLLILSTEEVIKAIFVKLHSENYNVYQHKSAQDFFF